MKVSALLGVDLGTSSVKGVAFDLTGRALASREIPCGYTIPQPGWAEADALVWWDAVRLIPCSRTCKASEVRCGTPERVAPSPDSRWRMGVATCTVPSWRGSGCVVPSLRRGRAGARPGLPRSRRRERRRRSRLWRQILCDALGVDLLYVPRSSWRRRPVLRSWLGSRSRGPAGVTTVSKDWRGRVLRHRPDDEMMVSRATAGGPEAALPRCEERYRIGTDDDHPMVNKV